MQTSRFQLGLMAVLAIGLGYTLSSSQAVGYPAGAVVSAGANPIVSVGGEVRHASSTDLLTAPSDQDIILTDLVLTSWSDMDCKRSHQSRLILSSGTVVGEFETNSGNAMRYYDYDSDSGLSISHSFSSGLRVPAGETLSLEVNQTGNFGSCDSGGGYGVRYAVSGYQAQP